MDRAWSRWRGGASSASRGEDAADSIGDDADANAVSIYAKLIPGHCRSQDRIALRRNRAGTLEAVIRKSDVSNEGQRADLRNHRDRQQALYGRNIRQHFALALVGLRLSDDLYSDAITA